MSPQLKLSAAMSVMAMAVFAVLTVVQGPAPGGESALSLPLNAGLPQVPGFSLPFFGR